MANWMNAARRGVRTGAANEVSVTITDLADANFAALVSATGSVGVANGGVALPVNYWFKVGGAGDTVDNALQGIKGSAPVANDRFKLNFDGTGSYLGTGL